MASMNPDIARLLQRINAYPGQIWYSIATLMSIVAVAHAASCLHAKFAQGKPRKNDQESNLPKNPSTLNPRRVPLAILNTYRVAAFRWTLDIKMGQKFTLNLAEVFFTTVYIIAIFTWTFINTTSISGKKLDYYYWSNRAGAIAASQFPLITLLGTKNNFIGLLSGVSYEKLNFVHRMASRVVFVLIWTHATSKFTYKLIRPEDWNMTWLPMGITAAVAFSILVLVSLRPVRARSYGLFFWTHFTMVLVLLVGAYRHTREFMLQKYIWPCFVIWGLDRFIRTLRITLFFFKGSRMASNPGPLSLATCNLEVISHNIIRMAIPRPSHFHWSAGQSVFLTIQGASLLWLGNPFTIASLDGEHVHNGDRDHTGQSTEAEEDIDEWSQIGKSELVFFLKIHSGFTKRLAALQTLGTEHKMCARIFVDGPYGSPPDLKYFDTCVLIAGGTGVSYTLPLLLDIVNKVRMGKSGCCRVLFIWAVRDIRLINLISSTRINTLRHVLSTLNVDIRIHVTKSNVFLHSEADDGDASSAGHHVEMVEKSTLQPTTASVLGLATDLIPGRPDIHNILKEEVDNTRGGRLGVCVCGPDRIVHATRSALGISSAGPSIVMRGGADVSLFVESFGYT